MVIQKATEEYQTQRSKGGSWTGMKLHQGPHQALLCNQLSGTVHLQQLNHVEPVDFLQHGTLLWQGQDKNLIPKLLFDQSTVH